MFWNKTHALELVELTYAMVDDHNAYQDLFARIEHLFGESKYFLQMWDDTIKVDHDSIVQRNWDASAVTDYIEHYSTVNRFLPLASQFDSGSAYQIYELAPCEVTSRWEFVNDFLLPNGNCAGVAATILKGDSIYGALAIEGPRHTQQHWYELEALVRVLNPHLKRVMQLNRQLQRASLYQSIAEISTEHVAAAMIVTDGDSVIKYASSNATQFLSEGGVLQLGPGGFLCAATTDQTHALQRLIHNATMDDCISAASAGGFMTLHAVDGRRLLSMVSPLSRGMQKRIGLTQGWPMTRKYAVVFLADPDQRTRLPSELLSTFFGLTEKEAALAMHLGGGGTLASYSESQFVSQNTARTQLKSVFRKTGVKRQSELVALLNRLSAFGQAV